MESATDNFFILKKVITSNFRFLKMFNIKEPQFWVYFEFSQGNNHYFQVFEKFQRTGKFPEISKAPTAQGRLFD
jgi:hypothetical protein